MTDYAPIDCDQHSVLELLAMHRTASTIEYDGDRGEVDRCRGAIVDVLTRDRAEFLALVDDRGQRIQLRLDRLRLIQGADGNVLWRQISDKLP